MANRRSQLGMTLIEITVVVAIIATLVGFGVPAVRALFGSFQSERAVRAMVQSTLSAARTLALSRQTAVGVRFQRAYDPVDPSRLPEGDQYMVLIEHAPSPTEIGYAREFHALVGFQPVRLPTAYTVIDLRTTPRSGAAGVAVRDNADVNEVDLTTFTILFAPDGQMVVDEVRVRNADGKDRARQDRSQDRRFNTPAGLSTLAGRPGWVGPAFLLDDDRPGRFAELSRDRFYIVERARLRRGVAAGSAWDDTLADVSTRPLYVAPYNGQLIEAQP